MSKENKTTYSVMQGRRSLASTEWLTPPSLLEKLGPFDLDPCSAINRPWDVAAINYTSQDDGLQKEWEGRVWMNPPFGKGIANWINKLANHGDGYALIPLRSTDAKWFHNDIWDSASAILFMRGRIKYFSITGKEGGSCPHASIIVAYGKENAGILFSVKIPGKWVGLK